MGVPALFRWLSKKYPKIIYPVEEEEELSVQDENDEPVTIPINMSNDNPNGVEFDNLYLDMNGIVHPCTHPEGKPAPETEEEMMLEVFKYTERVVNMIRPRKLLFMAIDGVAPRAKMNQQRSRRFRAAQEAKEKEEAHKEAVAMWEAMGKKKMNNDPGWQKMQVIISDASVAGEGEHKIMDFIRRQRSNPSYNPNTKHVIYGLDADLIMLALATHEPHFRVLREDVFANDKSSTACRMCGQEGHYAAHPHAEKKPFIFLDVAVLREYLEVELDVPGTKFDLERAIDDWVLLIFFVGNDFLPHLPSLEIREGAIDTLLKIWKHELPRMGGYLAEHGNLNLERAQIILEGLAKREDDIFRRRREASERQDQNAKRRKIEQQKFASGPGAALALTEPTTSLRPPIPERPRPAENDFAANAEAMGLGSVAKPVAEQNVPQAVQAWGGSNRDVVANRRAIRMANMSAAELLKAELAGLAPVKPAGKDEKAAEDKTTNGREATDAKDGDAMDGVVDGVVVANGNLEGDATMGAPSSGQEVESDAILGDIEVDDDVAIDTGVTEESLAGAKRSFEEGPGSITPVEEDVVVVPEEDDDDGATTPPANPLALKKNADGSVEQEDVVKLWEPGYADRYYRSKFGVEPKDLAFRKEVALRYVEGLAWVLHYYYQGTPSWHWYYPYHFAPFAADFRDVAKMHIHFDLGKPFRPYEQLMGVFPATSGIHIPAPFRKMMTDENSPILDFYPETFEIDMNGKKMAWQGVALLPFIDEKRLLAAMAPEYENLTEDEKRRNEPGNDVIFAQKESDIYPFYEALYGKKKQKTQEPIPIDSSKCYGLSGSVLPNPDCIPGSTYFSPLSEQGIPDIRNDQSLSVLYFFPSQLTPHRSVMLPGAKKEPRVLTSQDMHTTRNGGGRGRGRGGGYGGGDAGYSHNSLVNDPFRSRAPNYNSYGNDRGGGGGDRTGGGNYGRGGYYGRGGGGGGGGGGSYQGGQSQNYGRGPPAQQSYGSQGYNSGFNDRGRGGGGGGGRGGYPSSDRPPQSNNYGGYGQSSRGGGGYAAPPPSSRGGRGGYNSGYSGGQYNAPAPPPAQPYNSYNAAPSYGGGGDGGGYGGYGGYGAPAAPPPQYGGPPPAGAYGGYGEGPVSTSYPSSYAPRGGPPYAGRGRGRGY
ncbi:XRN 5'-3' exonuclease N-terminus-domain-containing protein [Ephemerocybe angulata]|uniref:5'-3' exoribonuclease n=1 Tax=Ephemerocybe angulata TaxID=980116 RepID=A0A8H6IE01_9AGAR|nr:XRN 5'-3' exonuclease N-terminus-domain-containing protein [Tulosesus angulatus]